MLWVFYVKLTSTQGRSQRGATDANAPVRLGGAPTRTSYPPAWSCPSEFSWFTYEASCSQLSSFEVPGDPNRDSNPSYGPLERPEAQDQEPMGPLWRTRGSLGPPYDGTPWSYASASKNGSYVYASTPYRFSFLKLHLQYLFSSNYCYVQNMRCHQNVPGFC